MERCATTRTPGTWAIRDSYEIGIDSRMFARFITRSRVSLIFDAAYSNPEITPFNTPNSRKATAIDNTVRTVRIGLRHRPAHNSGKYFIGLNVPTVLRRR